MKPRLVLLPLAGAAAVLIGSAAHGETDPWYLGARAAVTTESGGRDDTYVTTSLRGGLDVPLGRQRVFADASVSNTRFDRHSQSNTDGYGLNAGIDWQTIERLSGDVRVRASRSLAPFTFVGLQTTAGGAIPVSETFDNVEKLQDVSASARLGVVTPLTIEGTAGHREVSYTATQYAPLEYQQDRGRLGVVYRFSDILSLGTGVSVQETDYPNAIGGPDASSRRDVYVSARWVPTGASAVTARINGGKIEFDRETVRNFSGATGYVAWDWRPTGKLRFVTTLARDAGQDARFIQLRLNDVLQLPQLADFSRVSNSLTVHASHAYSGKLSFGAALQHVRSQEASSVVGDRSENATALSLSATWLATRSLSFGCETSYSEGSQTRSATALGCYGQFTLR